MPGSSLGDRFTASIKDLSIILKDIGKGRLLNPEDNQQLKDSSTTLVEALQSLSDIFVSPPNRTAQTPERPAIVVQRVAASSPQPPALAPIATVQRVAASASQPSATAPIVIVQRVLPIVLPPVPIHDILPLQRAVVDMQPHVDTRVEEASLQRVVAPTPPPYHEESSQSFSTCRFR